MTALDKLREALVAGVGGQMPPGKTWNLDKALEPLLPVVDRIANERAAAELRAAAEDLATVPGNPYPLVVSEFLNGRADALDPT